MGTYASSKNLDHGFPTPGPQAPTGQKVMDHIFFLSKEKWKQAREQKEYDFVVIGTGFCSLAFVERALKKDPHCRILVLERGSFFLPEHFQNLPLPYKDTLGGMSETFPWSLSAATASGQAGTIRWQHGMVPFFGGRSILWSSWCPRPTIEEMDGWPEETVNAVHEYFDSAEALLCVQGADEVDANKSDQALQLVCHKRPVYGALQRRIQTLLEEKATSVKGVYRAQAAPLASVAEDTEGIDFQKFSTPGAILTIANRQAELKREGKGEALDIVTECIVEKIIQQNGTATALQTSRGVLPLGNARLILAMGTLPPTTLISNSFPQLKQVGRRFSAHFISAIVARVPKADLAQNAPFGDLELGACYVAGVGKNYKQQFHIQLSVLSDKEPVKNAGIALRYMPDVVATASLEQLTSSQDHVVFVCAVLGELDYSNKDNWFIPNDQDNDITTNSLLQVTESQNDHETWDAMDQATFSILEEVLSPQGSQQVEYWHDANESADKGYWSNNRPSVEERRVDALVHESSTLHLGNNSDTDPVDLNYKLRGTENVYITGGGLWPQGGSWNPTMTMVALTQHLADQLMAR